MRYTFLKLFKNQTNSTNIQLFRYIFIGGGAFIVDIGALYILTNFFGIYYLVSAAIAFILGLIMNYALSITWVFKKHNLNSQSLEIGIFSLIGIVGLSFNEVFIWIFTVKFGFYYLISKIMAAIIILFWNFFARKFTLFK